MKGRNKVKRLIKLLVCLVVTVLLLASQSYTENKHGWFSLALKGKINNRWSTYTAFENRTFEETYYQHLHTAVDYQFRRGFYLGTAYRYCMFYEPDKTEHRAMLNFTAKSGIFKNRARISRRFKVGNEDAWRFRNKMTIKIFKFYYAYEFFLEQEKHGIYRDRNYFGFDFRFFNLFWMTQETEGETIKIFGVYLTARF